MFCSFIFKCYLLRFKKDRKRTSNWNKSWVIKYGLNFFPCRSYVDIYLHISALWFRYFLFVITNYNCYRCGIFLFFLYVAFPLDWDLFAFSLRNFLLDDVIRLKRWISQSSRPVVIKIKLKILIDDDQLSFNTDNLWAFKDKNSSSFSNWFH